MTKRKIPSVKTVGLGVLNPDFLVVYHLYSPHENDRVFAYPPMKLDDNDEDFSIPEPEDGERNYVILTAPERYLELRPFAKNIYRLLVCGKSHLQKLLELGVPIIDAQIEDGKVITSTTFDAADDLRQLIEEEAVPLRLSKLKKKKKPIEQTDDSELLPMLQNIKSQFDGVGVDFENVVLIPTVFRLIREMDRSEFKDRCKFLEEKGVDKKACREFYRYMERKRDRGKGGGLKLANAVKKYLNGSKKLTVLADIYGLPPKDIRWVANAVKKLEAEMEND